MKLLIVMDDTEYLVLIPRYHTAQILSIDTGLVST